MKDHLEIERKFLIKNWNDVWKKTCYEYPALKSAFKIIKQIYLKSDTGESRVRHTQHHTHLLHKGSSDFFNFYTRDEYTFTRKNDISGNNMVLTRDEKEFAITKEIFDEEVQNYADKNYSPILKVRYELVCAGNLVELDIFLFPSPGLIMAEVEVPSEDCEVKLPEFWVVEEVTNNKQFKNKQIAKIGNEIK